MDLFSADLNSLSNDQRYLAIADFARTQPVESNRHDFKVVWNNDTLKDVAAFANTFGGVLVIGVEKNQNDAEATLVGVQSASELTTGIASSIATNISPTPSYDITECHKPDEPNIRFCIIRIRSDTVLHLVTKKDVANPVWFRNADQTVRADAAQLRMMIERERQSHVDVADALLGQARRLLEDMVIGTRYTAEIEQWPMGSFFRSETYLKLTIMPLERRSISLDLRTESEFVALIHEGYRRIRSNLAGPQPVAGNAVNRGGDFFEYRWYHRNLDYENRWRITDSLAVAHATQINQDSGWSLVDVVMYLILLIKIAAKWWDTLNYFGDGILYADLSVHNLGIAQGKSGQYIRLFGPAEGDYGMRAEVLSTHPQQRAEAQAYVSTNFANMRSDLPTLVTSLMNLLLRSLGHGVLWDDFRENVRIISEGRSR